MASAGLHPLSLGEILDGAFRLYRIHFMPLAGAAAAIIVPLLALKTIAIIA